jgi:hypothetical protein
MGGKGRIKLPQYMLWKHTGKSAGIDPVIINFGNGCR